MMLVLGMLGAPFSTAPASLRPGPRPVVAPRVSVRRRVEPRVRRIVAEQLAISPDELVPAVSLTDERAADSLDVLQLVLAIESEFDIVLPQPAIAAIRSYGDVVDTVVASIRDAGRDESVTDRAFLVRSRITSDRTLADESVRVDGLTPYALETIAEAALHAGRGARLEIAVSSHEGVQDAALSYVRGQLAWLEERGIQVAVRRA
jgi:acyl carrier protein